MNGNTSWSLDSINPEGNGEIFHYLFWMQSMQKTMQNLSLS